MFAKPSDDEPSPHGPQLHSPGVAPATALSAASIRSRIVGAFLCCGADGRTQTGDCRLIFGGRRNTLFRCVGALIGHSFIQPRPSSESPPRFLLPQQGGVLVILWDAVAVGIGFNVIVEKDRG